MPKGTLPEASLQFWRAQLPEQLAKQLIGASINKSGHHTVTRLQTSGGRVWFGKVASSKQASHECDLLCALNADPQTADLVPNILYFELDKGLMVSSECRGQHPTKACLLNRLSQFVASLVKIHGFHGNPAIELGTRVEFHKLRCAVPPDRHSARFERELVQAKRNVDRHSPLVGRLHGDLNPYNVLVDESKWHFLDWEYSRVGDVRWDLAALATEFDFSQFEYLELLRLYCKQTGEDYRRLAEIADDWILVYIGICLGWCGENNQPKDKYLNYYERYFLN